MSEVQKAYDEWVATSTVSNSPQYRNEMREYCLTRAAIMEETPAVTYDQLEEKLSKFKIVRKENLKDCCHSSHFTRDMNGVLVELPDEHVCARERAWRRYCSVRDSHLRKEMN